MKGLSNKTSLQVKTHDAQTNDESSSRHVSDVTYSVVRSHAQEASNKLRIINFRFRQKLIKHRSKEGRASNQNCDKNELTSRDAKKTNED